MRSVEAAHDERVRRLRALLDVLDEGIRRTRRDLTRERGRIEDVAAGVAATRLRAPRPKPPRKGVRSCNTPPL